MKFELHKQLKKILANSAVTKRQERNIKLKSKLANSWKVISRQRLGSTDPGSPNDPRMKLIEYYTIM